MSVRLRLRRYLDIVLVLLPSGRPVRRRRQEASKLSLEGLGWKEKKKRKDKIKRWMKHKQSAEKVHENQFAARTGEKASGHFKKANRIKIFLN